MARVLLFEWTAGGHRPIYVRRLVEALRPSTDVVLALPQTTLDVLGDLGVETLSLGANRHQSTHPVIHESFRHASFFVLASL